YLIAVYNGKDTCHRIQQSSCSSDIHTDLIFFHCHSLSRKSLFQDLSQFSLSNHADGGKIDQVKKERENSQYHHNDPYYFQQGLTRRFFFHVFLPSLSNFSHCIIPWKKSQFILLKFSITVLKYRKIKLL